MVSAFVDAGKGKKPTGLPAKQSGQEAGGRLENIHRVRGKPYVTWRATMKRLLKTVLTTFFFAQAIPAWAQEEHPMNVTPLADHIYEVSYYADGYPVKVVASIGDDGMLLVDAGDKEAGEDFKATLKTLYDGPPDIIVVTHQHVEHVAGLLAFGKGPVVIGHPQVRTRLRSGSYIFDEFPDYVLPEITFTDSLSLYFNGEEIKLVAVPGSHSDNDIIAWFTQSKVVCVGAVSNGSHFPSVDGVSGDILKYPEIAKRVIDMLPEDVLIVPGHSENCSMDDLKAFHDMLVKTTEIVRAGLAEGKDGATMQKEDVLKDFKSFEGPYTPADYWIGALVKGLQRAGKEARKSVFEPVYYALRDNGTDAAVELLLDLKNNHADEYEVGETQLLIVAYKLHANDRLPEAIRFYDLTLSEYPEGKYAATCYNYLGEAYKAMGNKQLALKNFRKFLELRPDDAHAAEMIQELEGK